MRNGNVYLLAVAVCHFFVAGTAFAHHPVIVSAEPLCDVTTGEYAIAYTTEAWTLTGGFPLIARENSQVDIDFGGLVVVDSGAYTPENGYMFSGIQLAGAAPGSPVPVTATAVADWGNGYDGGQSASVTVRLPDDPCIEAGGRFTGGGGQALIVNGLEMTSATTSNQGNGRSALSRPITRGLTIHCDLLLSNNLQINWPGNHFHMTEHTSAVCMDDPMIQQHPPRAPLDTIMGIGTGRWNNMEGYTIEFTLVDAGEPGRNDMASFLIYETANPANVILDLPLMPLSNGNLQAHYDQPHVGNGNK